MVMENSNKMLQAEKKQIKPKDEISNKINNTVSRSPWLKLSGSAAGGLGEVFLGSGVAVLQDREVKAPAEDTTNSAQTGQEYVTKVGVYNAFMPTTPGQGAEGRDAQEPEKAVTSKVKTERVPPRIVIPGPAGTHKCIKVLKLYRIVLLGEAGAGKSSLGNNIFGENVFKINQPPKCRGSRECQVEAKSVHGRRIMLVDTPGFDGTDGPEPDLKDEILRGITECAPGPHAFLIVLKVEKFTNQKKAAIEKIGQLFSEEAFKYAAVVFILGDQLPEGMNIEEFVDHNKCLSDLVKKCSGGYHVVDNRCNQEKDCNQLQILQLLNTIEKIGMENKGGCYTNKLLQAKKETGNTTSVGNLPQAETENEANNSACRNMWIKLSGPAGDAVAEAFFGPTVGVVQEICGDQEAENEDRGSSTNAEEGENSEREAGTKSEAEEGNKSNTEEDTEDENEEEIEETNVASENEARKVGGKKDAQETGEEEATDESEERKSTMEEVQEKEERKAKFYESIFAAVGSIFAAFASIFSAVRLIFAASTAAATASLAAATGSTPSATGSTPSATGSTPSATGSTPSSTPSATGSTPSATGSTPSASGSLAAATGSAVALKLVEELVKAAAVIIPKIQWFIEKFKQLLALLRDLKEHGGVILLVVVFYLLLALSFCANVPAAGTILLSLGILAMFLLIVALFLVI
ncbi:uncharacterized protein LOC121639999 isoform X2 [Melanotaenia boesemani]|uniref:uncharacterized protein LOC121639999 isoform X2 n=1 Tax=Melanotaenia boesemani TaxID=1250792 RepID=UPI001C04E90C|nr:uncharacterized protein LOC121639999 isoform X2 [Melanotaenia boesemani]